MEELPRRVNSLLTADSSTEHRLQELPTASSRLLLDIQELNSRHMANSRRMANSRDILRNSMVQW